MQGNVIFFLLAKEHLNTFIYQIETQNLTFSEQCILDFLKLLIDQFIDSRLIF